MERHDAQRIGAGFFFEFDHDNGVIAGHPFEGCGLEGSDMLRLIDGGDAVSVRSRRKDPVRVNGEPTEIGFPPLRDIHAHRRYLGIDIHAVNDIKGAGGGRHCRDGGSRCCGGRWAGVRDQAKVACAGAVLTPDGHEDDHHHRHARKQRSVTQPWARRHMSEQSHKSIHHKRSCVARRTGRATCIQYVTAARAVR